MGPPTEAAVLVPAYRDAAGVLRVVLIRRRERGRHAGEIAFPGGRREPGDGSLRATAVRETGEEIGLAPADIDVLAALPVVETVTTGFVIHPFLARVRPPGTWAPQPDEVAAVVEPAIDALLRPQARRRERIEGGQGGGLVVDCLRAGELRIWGATYRILAPVLGRLAQAIDAD